MDNSRHLRLSPGNRGSLDRGDARVFNMGIGFVAVCSPDRAAAVEAQFTTFGHTTYRIGTVTQSPEGLTTRTDHPAARTMTRKHRQTPLIMLMLIVVSCTRSSEPVPSTTAQSHRPPRRQLRRRPPPLPQLWNRHFRDWLLLPSTRWSGSGIERCGHSRHRPTRTSRRGWSEVRVYLHGTALQASRCRRRWCTRMR